MLWADYEELDWDRILDPGSGVRANSYLVRKGLSRKAQLAFHLRKYLAKRPDSPMAAAVPETLVIETWEAFEEEMSFGALGAKYVPCVFCAGWIGLEHGCISPLYSFVCLTRTTNCPTHTRFDAGLTSSLSQTDRLDWCLRDIKERMECGRQQDGQQQQQQPQELWILKPSVTNKGAEVQVVRDYATVRATLRAWPDAREWVLQSYVAQPLLFQGRKFHLRAYVLAVGDLAVYMWRRVLLLSSAVRYDADDLDDQLAHITNTARQADGLGRRFREDACVHLLEDLVGDLREECGYSTAQAQGCVDAILAGMEAVTGELFRALHGEPTVFAPMPHCFELFGLDFLVSLPDEAERPSGPQVHLLEVNPGPDFKQSGCRLRGVVRGLLEAALDVAVLGEEPPEDLALVYDDSAAGAGLRRGAGAGGGMRLLSSS